MMFNKEEIDLLKSILQNADDNLLCELFGDDLFKAVKEKLKEAKRISEAKSPYQFNQRFPDIK
jgi:hypothetical protein